MYPNSNLYTFDLYTYFKSWGDSAVNLILGILDLVIVLFLLYKGIKFFRKTRAWQLLKGIAVLVIVTLVSRMGEAWDFECDFDGDYDVWCDYFDCCVCSGT